MAEAQEAVAKKVTRWFVSKYAEAVITITPADHVVIAGHEVRQKAVRLVFKKMLKPPRYWGTGLLGSSGSEGVDGSDRNSARYCSVLKTEDPAVIEFLRKHEWYLTSVQDNQLDKNFQPLEELDFDPEKRYGQGSSGLVTARTEKDLAGDGEEARVDGAPDEGRSDPAKASVGLQAKGGRAKF